MLISGGFSYFEGVLVLVELGECCGVRAEDAGSEQAIVSGQDKIAGRGRQGAYRDEARLGWNVVAAKEIQAIELVGRYEPLDLVENGERIKRAQARFKTVGCEPDGVAVGFAGLRSAGLAHVCCRNCQREQACGRRHPCRRPRGREFQSLA
jgi:hypothetical protein